jgi:hypothetical protein
MGETKPRQISHMLSIAYSDFRTDFREVSTDQRFLDCRFGWPRPTDPNKPNVANACVVNNMTEKSAKQTQRICRICYQLLTAILAPICRKFEWKAGASLTGIRAQGPCRKIGDSRLSASCPRSPRSEDGRSSPSSGLLRRPPSPRGEG